MFVSKYCCIFAENLSIITIFQEKYMAKGNQENSLVSITKSNIWEFQENDILRFFESVNDDNGIVESTNSLISIIRTAFEIEEVKIDRPEVLKKYEARGMQVGELITEEGTKKYALKKRAIKRVTDLTYENIHHISAVVLLEVLDRNFGGGWDSLAQSIKDIIEAGFDISTTTLPQDRLHKPGGLCEKKLADGFEMLEIPKGTWVEAIFAKAKPKVKKIGHNFGDMNKDMDDDYENEDEDVEISDNYYTNDDDDDDFDEDKLTEESYRTTYDESQEDLTLDSGEIGDVYDEE